MAVDFIEWSPLEVQHLAQVLFRLKFDGEIREETGHPALNRLLNDLCLHAEQKLPISSERSFVLGMFDQNISDYLLNEIVVAKKSDYYFGRTKTPKDAIYSVIYPLKYSDLQSEKIDTSVEEMK